MKATKSMKSRYENILESYVDIENMLYDVEFIHKFRVNVRELRSLLYFIKPILKAKNNNSINEFLKN
jgi:CHAD domain.